MASLRTLEKGLFLAALALVACTKEADDSDTGGNDTDTGDTSPVYLEPTFLAISGGFGFDEASGNIIDVSFPDIMATQGSVTGFTVSPYMSVDLYLQPLGSQLTEEDFVCTITVEQAGGFAKASALGSDTTQAIAFTFDFATATIEHDCDGLLDPAVWGEDLSEAIASSGVQWGMGVDATPAAAIAEWIEEAVKDQDGGDELWAEQWEGKILGARPFFSTTGTLISSGNEVYWGSAQAIDSNNRVLWDDTTGSASGVWEIEAEAPTGILAVDIPASGSYSVGNGPSVIGFEGLHQVFLGVEE